MQAPVILNYSFHPRDIEIDDYINVECDYILSVNALNYGPFRTVKVYSAGWLI